MCVDKLLCSLTPLHPRRGDLLRLWKPGDCLHEPGARGRGLPTTASVHLRGAPHLDDDPPPPHPRQPAQRGAAASRVGQRQVGRLPGARVLAVRAAIPPHPGMMPLLYLNYHRTLLPLDLTGC